MESAPLPADLVALRASLRALPDLRTLLDATVSEILGDLRDGIDPLEDLRDGLDRALVDDPPPGLKEGGIVREGWSPELDELRRRRDRLTPRQRQVFSLVVQGLLNKQVAARLGTSEKTVKGCPTPVP